MHHAQYASSGAKILHMVKFSCTLGGAIKLRKSQLQPSILPTDPRTLETPKLALATDTRKAKAKIVFYKIIEERKRKDAAWPRHAEFPIMGLGP